MKEKIIVISLGGSLIVPKKIDISFLKKFKKTINKNLKNYKFIIVCGGGNLAREYISALKNNNTNKKLQNYIGISATRMNARFMNYFFNKDSEKGIPHTIKKLKKDIKKQKIVFCGALEYKPNQTSDSTSAEIARYFKKSLINLTDVQGLYTADPKKDKKAKLIEKISWEKFNQKAISIKFSPGQHFVLDQNASEIIKNEKIITYILGKDMNQLDNLLKNKKFKGTIIKN
jgi:uridylate kinase